MKSLLLVILLPFAVLSAQSLTPAPAPAPALSDEETAKVLEEITKVQREFAKTKGEVLANALERFKAAAGDDARALDFFLASYRVVNLERKPATTKQEIEERTNGEWQKKAIASLGNGSSPAMMRMQLQLLVLMLEPAKDAGAAIAALRSYMHDVIAFLPSVNAAMEQAPARRSVATVSKRGTKKNDDQAAEKERLQRKSGATKLLRQNVMSTLFAEAYNLGAYFEAPAQWPQSPVDFRAAYANVILPWYRANKKTELPEVWDEYLKSETTLQQISLTPEALTEWGAKEYKQLYWSKWLDLLASGVTATTATQELVKTIRENPNHPALKTWIADLAKVAETLGGLKFGEAEFSGAK